MSLNKLPSFQGVEAGCISDTQCLTCFGGAESSTSKGGGSAACVSLHQLHSNGIRVQYCQEPLMFSSVSLIGVIKATRAVSLGVAERISAAESFLK